MIKRFIKNSKITWQIYCWLRLYLLGKNKTKISGKNNILKVENALINKSEIIINGNNNKIYFNYNVRFSGKIFIYGNNNVLIVEENCTIKNSSICFEDDGNYIIIKNNTSIESNSDLSVIEGTKIEIGSDCMISSEVFIRTGDSHSILNTLGERINPSKDIKIGTHVWLGHRSIIQKGAKISNNSIVSSTAIVTKQFEQSNCVLSGIPAKITKENINWNKYRV